MGTSKPLFRDINADDPDPEVTEVDSLCMNCQETVIVKKHLRFRYIKFFFRVLQEFF